MKKRYRSTSSLWGSLTLVLVCLSFSPPAESHCDGLDGPVVTAAREALETEDLNLVLSWIQEADEQGIRDVFEHTLAVRKLSPEAEDLADRHFFETLVRVHRAGEGAPYTGLKPAGRDLGPAIPAADNAIREGSEEKVIRLLTDKIRHGIHERFQEVNERKGFNQEEVEAGREYVEAYVRFVHYVEGIYQAASASDQAHHADDDVNPPNKGHSHSAHKGSHAGD